MAVFVVVVVIASRHSALERQLRSLVEGKGGEERRSCVGNTIVVVFDKAIFDGPRRCAVVLESNWHRVGGQHGGLQGIDFAQDDVAQSAIGAIVVAANGVAERHHMLARLDIVARRGPAAVGGGAYLHAVDIKLQILTVFCQLAHHQINIVRFCICQNCCINAGNLVSV